MDVELLHSELKAKKFRNFYIFTGEEIGVQNIYLKQISKISDLPIVRADSVDEILPKLKRDSLLGSNACYAVRDGMTAVSKETAWKVRELLGRNILILLYTKLDGRSNFVKQFKQDIFEFKILSVETLARHLAKEISLTSQNARYLIEICQSDYSRLMLEADKIKRLSADLGVDHDTAFRKMVIDGTIYSPPEDLIFDFANAVLDNKPADAWEAYYQTIRFGNVPLTLITLLYNSTKQLLQVQSCDDPDIAKTTGLSSGQIYGAKKHCGIWRNSKLIRLMSLLHDAEMGIKLGEVPDTVALPVVLNTFFVS